MQKGLYTSIMQIIYINKKSFKYILLKADFEIIPESVFY